MRSSRAHHARSGRGLAATLLAVILTAGLVPAVAADAPTRTLVPIGSDYQADTLQRFALAAARHDASGHVVILVLPITYSLDAYTTKTSERKRNLSLADHRRAMILDACEAVRAASQTCDVQLVPVLIRSDASDPSDLAPFSPDVDGMYVLGGDQTVGMEVVAGTPLEAAMAAAYNAGAVFGGNSAGMAVQSRDMINGYTGANGPAESMRQGAVDVWQDSGPGDLTRGLSFGFPDLITDQHVFEYGRMGRSLNVAVSSGRPVLGMDAATGGVVVDYRTLTDVVGDTAGYVVDPLTWGATAAWRGPDATLSTRGVAMHLLPPATYGFDFSTMEPTVGGVVRPAPSIAGRSYPTVSTPPGAAPLLLSGGIAGDPTGLVGQRFLSLAGGRAARITVLAAGYPSHSLAVKDAKAFAAALQPSVDAAVQWFVLDGKTDAAAASAAIAGATGILVTGTDRSTVASDLAAAPAVVAAVRARWAGGAATVVADDAVAAAMGARFIADGISPDVEASAPLDLLSGGVAFGDGLGWVGGLDVEPRLLPDQNEAQLLRLVADRPSALAVGIDVGTAVEVQGGAATTVGDSVALVVDGRFATFGAGTNTALAATWLVVDSFAAGEVLAP